MSSPKGGMTMSLTNEVTILPKAAPMMTPIAKSTTLPRMANSRNSLSIVSLLYCPRAASLAHDLAPPPLRRYRRPPASRRPRQQGFPEMVEKSKSNDDVDGVAAGQLKQFVARIERLEEEKKTLQEDIKEVYAEAK